MNHEDTVDTAEDLSAWLELTRQAVSSLDPKVNFAECWSCWIALRGVV
jgi:hypothetical protein